MAVQYPADWRTSATDSATSTSSSTIRMSFAMGSFVSTRYVVAGGRGHAPCDSLFARGGSLGKIDGERRPFSRLAFDPNGPAVCLDDLAGNVQAEPQSTSWARCGGLLVPVEDPLLVLGSDAYPVIDNHQASYRTSLLDRDFDRLAATKLERVGEQVCHDLLHANEIPHANDGGHRADLDGRMHSAGFLAKAADHVADNGSKVDFPEFEPKTSRGDSRDVHELFDESRQPLDLFERLLQLRFHLLARKDGLGRSAWWQEQHLDLQLERRQRGPELVRSDR